MRWLSRLLCWFECHDWREMDGTCHECGKIDPLWHG